MDWQLLVVTAFVVAATAYLGRRAWRTWRGGCSHCGSRKSPEANGPVTLIPVEQLTLRRRLPEQP